MVSCSRVEHSVDFTTAVKKKGAKRWTFALRTRTVRIFSGFGVSGSAVCFRVRQCLVLETEFQPRCRFKFQQHHNTPPFLRISRAESTHAMLPSLP